MSGNRRCAYCGSEQGLTRKHAIPKFIYSRETLKGDGPPLSHVIAQGEEKFVQSEIVIADVCGRCNSGFLSQLDAYGAKLYDQYFDIAPQPGTRVDFRFEFNLLIRWLLKLAYNFGRIRRQKWPGSFLEQLRRSTTFINGNAPCPLNLRTYIQLITPAKLSPLQKQEVFKDQGLEMEEIEPRFRRCLAFVGAGMDAAFLIGMNGYQFYLVFWESSNNSQQMRLLERKFLKLTLGAMRLPPNASKSVIYPSALNIIDVVRSNPLMKRNVEGGAAWVLQQKAANEKKIKET